jgi:hypothetical protein
MSSRDFALRNSQAGTDAPRRGLRNRLRWSAYDSAGTTTARRTRPRVLWGGARGPMVDEETILHRGAKARTVTCGENSFRSAKSAGGPPHAAERGRMPKESRPASATER